MTGGEFEAIERIRRRFPAIGDDAAVLDGGLLVAADAIVSGIDFTDATPRADVGWRAVAVNVSDIAAMGGRPESLLVTIAGPEDVDIDGIYDGIAEACAEYGCTVVGGDLSGSPVLIVAITVIGRGDNPVLRSGARSGDVVYVTGALGHAAASKYAVRPRARVDEGEAAKRAGATAMIDLSDGLAADLAHILDASGVGARVDAVPVSPTATEDQAWTGGDDYELLFTLPPDATPPAGSIRIGVITSDVTDRPRAGGWEHALR